MTLKESAEYLLVHDLGLDLTEHDLELVLAFARRHGRTCIGAYQQQFEMSEHGKHRDVSKHIEFHGIVEAEALRVAEREQWAP